MEKRTKTIIIFLALVFLMVISLNDYFKEGKSRKGRIARKVRINQLWQQYLQKDPNEEDFWAIIKDDKSYNLMDLASREILKITNSEHRLLYLLEEHKYDTELRIKIADRLLENPSTKGLKKIINMVPEKAENALLALLELVDPNNIEPDCLKDVIIDMPLYRKWAWDKILSKPEKIKPSLCYAFAVDPNYPKEAVDLYFDLNLKEEHYKQLIFYCPPLSERALKEFLITRKPEKYDLREIILGNRWDRHPEKKVKIEAAKYILVNDPSEEELALIRKKCPSLRREIQEIKKKILERKATEQKIIPKTKEDIIKIIEKIPY